MHSESRITHACVHTFTLLRLRLPFRLLMLQKLLRGRAIVLTCKPTNDSFAERSCTNCAVASLPVIRTGACSPLKFPTCIFHGLSYLFRAIYQDYRCSTTIIDDRFPRIKSYSHHSIVIS